MLCAEAKSNYPYLWTVTHQIDGAPNECDPQHPVLGQETVEILIQEEERRPQQTPVPIVHFAFCHVRDLFACQLHTVIKFLIPYHQGLI